MDDQHGILMDAINELRLALVRGAGREKICELLDQFIEFSRMHFASEERLMEQVQFAGLAEHRAEHQRILAGIIQSSHRMQYGEEIALRPLLCELHESLIDHIDRLDRLYAPCLAQFGVK